MVYVYILDNIFATRKPIDCAAIDFHKIKIKDYYGN